MHDLQRTECTEQTVVDARQMIPQMSMVPHESHYLSPLTVLLPPRTMTPSAAVQIMSNHCSSGDCDAAKASTAASLALLPVGCYC
eukprot:5242736-Amphidinium_carterae.1